jgi:hypothetical protein
MILPETALRLLLDLAGGPDDSCLQPAHAQRQVRKVAGMPFFIDSGGAGRGKRTLYRRHCVHCGHFKITYDRSYTALDLYSHFVYIHMFSYF